MAALALVATALAGSPFAAGSLADAGRTSTSAVHSISVVHERATSVRRRAAVIRRRKPHKRRSRAHRRSGRIRPVHGLVPLALPESGKAMFGISDALVPYQNSAVQIRDLDAIARTGARWVRVDFSWAAIQTKGPTSFNWSPWDAVVQAATARGLEVLGVISYTPPWALPAGVNAAASGSYRNPPAQAGAYGAFAGELAARYGPRGVHAWEIWNEPNVPAFFRPQPNPATYIALLKSAYESIKHNDRGATVVTGGVAPCSPANGIVATQWLGDLYAGGARGYFDAFGDHPYTFSLGGGTAPVSVVWRVEPTSPSILRAIMVAHGDSAKRIWGTEFGTPSVDASLPSVNEAVQANAIAQAYGLWKTYSWVGPLFTHTLEDPPNPDLTNYEDWFGLLRADGSPKPAYVTFESLVAGTS